MRVIECAECGWVKDLCGSWPSAVTVELHTNFSTAYREFLPKLEKCGTDWDQIVNLLLSQSTVICRVYLRFSLEKTEAEDLLQQYEQFFDNLERQLGASVSLLTYLQRPLEHLARFPTMLKVLCMPAFQHMCCGCE